MDSLSDDGRTKRQNTGVTEAWFNVYKHAKLGKHFFSITRFILDDIGNKKNRTYMGWKDLIGPIKAIVRRQTSLPSLLMEDSIHSSTGVYYL